MTIRHKLIANAAITLSLFVLSMGAAFVAIEHYDQVGQGTRLFTRQAQGWLNLSLQVNRYLKSGLEAAWSGREVRGESISLATEQIIHIFISLERTRRSAALYLSPAERDRYTAELTLAREKFGLIHAGLEKALPFIGRGDKAAAFRVLDAEIARPHLERDFVQLVDSAVQSEEASASRLEDDAQKLKTRMAALALLSALLGLGISGFLMTRINRSIRRSIEHANGQLLRGSEAIGSGDFDTQVEINTGDELAVVGKAFNKMASDLKAAQHWRRERDEANEANQMKSAFLANISHELRTPMHGILSFARFGQQKIETAPLGKLKTYFDEIHESGLRLMKLLNDLLDLSKLEAGKTEYAKKETDLSEIVSTVVSEMAAFAEEKGLAIEVKPAPLMAVLDGDKLMQVLRNLISNAIKFSDRGTAIGIELSLTPANQALCRVSNRGVGIPAAELEAVFDKFVQSTKTRTGAGGTGLGLAISKEIVRQHGGRIWAESSPNGQTVFSIELPGAFLAPDSSRNAA